MDPHVALNVPGVVAGTQIPVAGRGAALCRVDQPYPRPHPAAFHLAAIRSLSAALIWIVERALDAGHLSTEDAEILIGRVRFVPDIAPTMMTPRPYGADDGSKEAHVHG